MDNLGALKIHNGLESVGVIVIVFKFRGLSFLKTLTNLIYLIFRELSVKDSDKNSLGKIKFF